MKYRLISCLFDHTYCMLPLSYFCPTKGGGGESLLSSPNLVWSIRNTMSILHASV